MIPANFTEDEGGTNKSIHPFCNPALGVLLLLSCSEGGAQPGQTNIHPHLGSHTHTCRRTISRGQSAERLSGGSCRHWDNIQTGSELIQFNPKILHLFPQGAIKNATGANRFDFIHIKCKVDIYGRDAFTLKKKSSVFWSN